MKANPLYFTEALLVFLVLVCCTSAYSQLRVRSIFLNPTMSNSTGGIEAGIEGAFSKRNSGSFVLGVKGSFFSLKGVVDNLIGLSFGREQNRYFGGRVAFKNDLHSLLVKRQQYYQEQWAFFYEISGAFTLETYQSTDTWVYQPNSEEQIIYSRARFVNYIGDFYGGIGARYSPSPRFSMEAFLGPGYRIKQSTMPIIENPVPATRRHSSGWKVLEGISGVDRDLTLQHKFKTYFSIRLKVKLGPRLSL